MSSFYDRLTHTTRVHLNETSMALCPVFFTFGLAGYLLGANVSPKWLFTWIFISIVAIEVLVLTLIGARHCHCGVVSLPNKEREKKLLRKSLRKDFFSPRLWLLSSVPVLPLGLAIAIELFFPTRIGLSLSILLAILNFVFLDSTYTALCFAAGAYLFAIGATGKAERMYRKFTLLSDEHFNEKCLDGMSFSDLVDLTKSAVKAGDLEQADLISKKLLAQVELGNLDHEIRPTML